MKEKKDTGYRRYGRARLWLFWRAVVLSLVALGAYGETVPDLYRVEVPVAAQNSAELARAAAEGLREVLVRASGQRDFTDNDSVRRGLADAQSLVQQYQYLRRPLRPDQLDAAGTTTESPQPSQGQLVAELLFDRGQVQQLLRRAGLPLWSDDRPAVLVWLVVDTADGRELVNGATNPQWAESLREAAKRRGLAVKFPLLDLEDAQRLRPADVWTLREDRLLKASERYAPGAILAGKVSKVSSERLVGDWLFLFNERSRETSALAEDRTGFAAPALGLAADTLGATFAVWPVSLSEEGLGLRLSGVNSFRDYAGALQWLKQIGAVRAVDVMRADGDVLHIRLLAEGEWDQLRRLLEQDGHLVPESDGANTGSGLSYRWSAPS